ncbi:MAG TPA: ATP-binding protein [Candidatus Sabulitectum sp.]|nr:ATP-binding protein [Candidatus Sabulitectum sp.]HPJ28917.1 ATP-binding protein [Candidatus Sabulitectum sp.]HPR22908.1 ATP-binding protein [Candidatus Sabulitectum sp.]
MENEKRLKLLIVDDEEGMRMGVKRALRNHRIEMEDGTKVAFDVVEASSGEEAVSMMEQEPPDIVLLDNKMGGISGIDVLTWINERDLDLMAIMITAYASIETAITATKQGAYDFLPKPFTPAELKVSVRQASEHLLALRQTRALEEEKRRVRFQFISVLAHELKAPLGAIEGYLYLLRDGTGMDDPKVYERVVERSLVRLSGMRKLIYDLLDLTRLESGQKKRELAPTSVIEAARTAIETMTPDADARGIVIDLEAEGEITLEADRGELEIIFNNLISNAVKYNRDNGRVTVRLEETSEEVRIAVADTGIGMTPEEVEKLFGEFVRIKNDRTRNILGSGLGLSIMRKIASLYGGEVSVESAPDQGTTFTVILKKTLE